jgi:hypothetical protein
MKDSRAMCLRCVGVQLVLSEPLGPEIEFFDCPVCRRSYARKPGRSLTFRWLHPISLVLYDKLIDANPRGRARALPDATPQPSHQPERARRIIEEIELELSQPTQQVRDILGNPQTEEQCREFLREFVAKMRAGLKEEDTDSH